MAKPDAKKWPKLKQYWDDYGHMKSWDQLVDMKTNGAYAALAWDDDGEIQYAGLYCAGGEWEMLNDGGDAISKKQWTGARIKPDCDYLIIPEA